MESIISRIIAGLVGGTIIFLILKLKEYKKEKDLEDRIDDIESRVYVGKYSNSNLLNKIETLKKKVKRINCNHDKEMEFGSGRGDYTYNFNTRNFEHIENYYYKQCKNCNKEWKFKDKKEWLKEKKKYYKKNVDKLDEEIKQQIKNIGKGSSNGS